MNFTKIKIQMVKEKKYSYNSQKITSSLEIVKEINKIEELEKASEEKMILICLNTKNQIVSYSEIGKGGINYCLIDLKTIFKNVFLSNASKIILVHNHPSGDTKPSKEDLQLTKKIKQACQLMEIELLDHIIIADDNFESIIK